MNLKKVFKDGSILDKTIPIVSATITKNIPPIATHAIKIKGSNI
jgi:hypothetical protein